MTNLYRTHLKWFIKQSNAIEWEHHRKDDATNLFKFLHNPLTQENVCWYHKTLWPDEDWTGKYRTCNVRVWNHTPPDWVHVKNCMDWYFIDIKVWDSWTAHNEFEKIHPFQDFNGRLGRAIRLHKAIEQEWYFFQRSFLHQYYYQTLSHY
jgi:Fic family protein